LKGDGLPPQPQLTSHAHRTQEGGSHLLEGLLLLRRQGRQPQLGACALPILHLDGICALEWRATELFSNKLKVSLMCSQKPHLSGLNVGLLF
jgi:hypothetical protein